MIQRAFLVTGVLILIMFFAVPPAGAFGGTSLDIVVQDTTDAVIIFEY